MNIGVAAFPEMRYTRRRIHSKSGGEKLLPESQMNRIGGFCSRNRHISYVLSYLDSQTRHGVHRHCGAHRSSTLENGRDPLAAADTHRNQAVTPAGTVQFMDGLGADNRTSCTDRMSQ
jgi:hypothetical protein